MLNFLKREKKLLRNSRKCMEHNLRSSCDNWKNTYYERIFTHIALKISSTVQYFCLRKKYITIVTVDFSFLWIS